MSVKSGPKTLYPYRSNIVTFKITTTGLEQLQREVRRLGVLRGDLLEFLVRRYAREVTPEDLAEMRRQIEH